MFRANGKRQIQIENSQIRKWAAKHCPKQILIDKTGMNLLIFLKMLEPTVNWDKYKENFVTWHKLMLAVCHKHQNSKSPYFLEKNLFCLYDIACCSI